MSIPDDSINNHTDKTTRSTDASKGSSFRQPWACTRGLGMERPRGKDGGYSDAQLKKFSSPMTTQLLALQEEEPRLIPEAPVFWGDQDPSSNRMVCGEYGANSSAWKTAHVLNANKLFLAQSICHHRADRPKWPTNTHVPPSGNW